MCFPVAVCLAFALSVRSQVANNTSLVGTITDESGQAVSGVKVIAVNVGTNVSYPGTTNDDGYYSIDFIIAGTYNITIEHPGFSRVIQKGIIVETNQVVRTDIVLKVGATSELITVESTTPPIPTDDATLGETLNTRSVADLPLNGRDALQLAATTSNVIIGPKSSQTGIPPGEDFIGAGQREITNSLTLDGVTIMNNLITVTSVTPNLDAIQEVQMQNGNYTAQYGSYMGVHVNLVTKTGTNELHGTVYEFARNDKFIAHPFFDKPSAAKKPLRFNQFGTEIGGPVYLPKLYNGKNKTFFMASYEGLRQIRSTTQIGSTLTDAMRQGDFSAICTTGFNASGICTTASQQLTDPFTGLPYQNNKIPASELSSPAAQISQKILQYYPEPNLTGNANNFNGPVATNVSKNQTVDRVDQTFGDKIRLFVRYDWENMKILGGTITPTGSTSGPANNRNIAIGYTQIFTPNLVNDFRFGRNHLVTNALDYWYAHNLTNAGTALGIPGFTGDTTFGNPGVPDINVTGYMTIGNAGANWFQDDTTWHGYDQISYTHGKHNMMAGVELRKLTTGRSAANSPRGIFNFTGQLTGNAAADFILGVQHDDQTPLLSVKGVVAEWRDGFFALDNWQVTRKLTLNYGLRYELPTVPYTVDGEARILNPSQTALIPTTVPDAGFQFIRPNHDNWAPRLGFAYRLTEKTVVRGGGGFYYNPNQMNSFTLATTNPPFGVFTSYSSAAPYNLPTGCLLTLANPTPNNSICGGASSSSASHLNVFTENPYLPTPRMYQWSLGVERALWNGAGFEMDYLGSHSIHLDRSFYNNTPAPGPGSVNARRPNQLWGRIRTIQNDEIANYHGMTAILRQRMSHGLQLLASYTWSHTLDISSDSNGGGTPMNPYDWHLDYGNANWDIRHRFVASVVYDLPKFQSQGWLIHNIFGNWQLNGITTAQTGIPFNVAMGADLRNIGSGPGPNRPNLVGKASANCGDGHMSNCIDTTAFAAPAPYTYGNFGRNVLFGPGFVNTDFSLFKNIPIKERLKFEFRAEMFNVFNHPNFVVNSPQNFGTASFGSITQQAPNSTNRDIQFGGKIVF